MNVDAFEADLRSDADRLMKQLKPIIDGQSALSVYLATSFLTCEAMRSLERIADGDRDMTQMLANLRAKLIVELQTRGVDDV